MNPPLIWTLVALVAATALWRTGALAFLWLHAGDLGRRVRHRALRSLEDDHAVEALHRLVEARVAVHDLREDLARAEAVLRELEQRTAPRQEVEPTAIDRYRRGPR